jgi:putative toxin-antitoxin system antitoxin component (TIGR02293 family)
MQQAPAKIKKPRQAKRQTGGATPEFGGQVVMGYAKGLDISLMERAVTLVRQDSGSSPSTEALLGLSIDPIESPLSLPEIISNGLPISSIDAIAKFVAPDDNAFKYRLVPKATLERRRKSPSQTLTTEEGDRVARLAKVLSVALEIYKDPALVREFMTRSHQMLEGKQPIEVALSSSAGTDVINNLLQAMAYGGGV